MESIGMDPILDPRFWYSVISAEVVDGDTVDLELDMGLRLTVHGRFRLFGINSPERKTSTMAAGNTARDYLGKLLAGRKLVANTHRDSVEKYGRYLVSLYDQETGELLNTKMIEAGHAVEYLPV